MKPGKLYTFVNIAEPVKLFDFQDEEGFCQEIREIHKTDVLMLVKIVRAHNGCLDMQFLHKNGIGWIMFPYRNVEQVQRVLQEVGTKLDR
jgi:hypothetical protein